MAHLRELSSEGQWPEQPVLIKDAVEGWDLAAFDKASMLRVHGEEHHDVGGIP